MVQQEIDVTPLADHKTFQGEALEITDAIAEARTDLRKKRKKKKDNRRQITRLQTEYFDEEEEEKEIQLETKEKTVKKKHQTAEAYNVDRIVEMLSHLGNDEEKLSMDESII